jgi:hypothetical protein
MGLAERKVIAAVKETDYKAFESTMKTFCGFDVKMNLDWAQVGNNEQGLWIGENKKYNSYLLDRALEAVTKICSDDMSTEAVKSGLKEIQMFHLDGALEFKCGELTVRNDLTGNGAYQANSIQNTLEKGL